MLLPCRRGAGSTRWVGRHGRYPPRVTPRWERPEEPCFRISLQHQSCIVTILGVTVPSRPHKMLAMMLPHLVEVGRAMCRCTLKRRPKLFQSTHLAHAAPAIRARHSPTPRHYEEVPIGSTGSTSCWFFSPKKSCLECLAPRSLLCVAKSCPQKVVRRSTHLKLRPLLPGIPDHFPKFFLGALLPILGADCCKWSSIPVRITGS